MLLALQPCSLSLVSHICSMLASSACSLVRHLDTDLPELAQAYMQRLLRQTIAFGDMQTALLRVCC